LEENHELRRSNPASGFEAEGLTHGVNNDRLVDHLIGQRNSELRQMCAKVHPSLIDRLDQVTNLLDMSKREFIEAAV
jgi:hypothetical protein